MVFPPCKHLLLLYRLGSSIKIRDKLYKKYIKEKNKIKKLLLEKKYKTYRNTIVTLLRNSRIQHYQKYFQEKKQNIKIIWNGINEIIHSKRNTARTSPTSITINNRDVSNPIEMANEFNNFFTTISRKLKSKIRPSNSNFTDYLKNSNSKSFFVSPTTPQEIEDLISNMNKSKSYGPNSIPTSFLHLIKGIISEPLSKLFNCSFETGLFPDLMKNAKVIPVFKNGSKLACNNYRPISLLSNISKLIEKAMYKRLHTFCSQTNCLYDLQFGFRAKTSTSHALISIIEHIQKNIDTGNISCGIFIDLAKAFDTVDHKILLSKLKHYGIRGIANQWFQSYLSNRKQFVSINECNSKYLPVECGVPQGSILGPFLFLLYINDLNQAIKYSTVHHFADDTNLLYADKSQKTLTKCINHDLTCLGEWLRANQLSLNVKKTELVIFRNQTSNITNKYKFKINGQKITPTNTIKYLGITLDKYLTFTPHFSQLNLKLNRAVGILSKLRYLVPQKILQTIYHALFSSHMIYGCQVYAQSNTTIKNKVQLLQNKALRKITFSNLGTPMNNIYKNFKILKFDDYIHLQNCLFMHKFTTHELPKTFNNHFKLLKNRHNHNTRAAESNMINVPLVNTHKYGTLSIKNQCIQDWNNLKRMFPKINLTNQSYSKTKSLILEKLFSYY